MSRGAKMTEDTALVEKREELKRQLAAGAYRTLVDVMLDGTGRLIQKLTRTPEPLPFWYSVVVIALVTLLISFLTSVLLGEFYPLRREMILFEVSIVGIVLAIVVAGKMYFGILFTTLRDRLLDAIESVTDLADLQRWLAAAFDVKKPLFFGLAFGILLGFYSPILFATTRGGFLGFGPTILAVITDFQIGVLVYYGFPFLTLLARLSRYQFKLYAADPSSSEVIDHLSDMLSNSVYIAAIFTAIVTLVITLFGMLTLATTIILVLAGWGPLIAIFVINQVALAKIITKAKWKKLNEIQAKIETLEAQVEIPSEKTLAHLTRLMDYHDRIKATRNSALDLRAGLNFLNSLLLPLLAFVLANLKEVLKLFSGR
jgi:hypothetical protein